MVLRTSGQSNGGLTQVGRQGTNTPTWDWTLPSDYLNVTPRPPGGADMWFWTTGRRLRVDLIEWQYTGDLEHQLEAYDSTNRVVEQVVMCVHDEFVSYLVISFVFDNLQIRQLTT